jgi:hypothetical protein
MAGGFSQPIAKPSSELNYQVMPPLSDADYQALKCDIDEDEK